MLSWLNALDQFVAPFQPHVLLGYGNGNHSLYRPEMAVCAVRAKGQRAQQTALGLAERGSWFSIDR